MKDQTLANAELIRQGLAGRVWKALTYLGNRFLGQLAPFSALVAHVFVVVGKRSKEKMVYPHARRVVAAMKDIQYGIRSMMEFPSNAMGALGPPLSVVDLSVSLGELGSGPNPALSRLIDLGPKSDFQGAVNVLAMGHT